MFSHVNELLYVLKKRWLISYQGLTDVKLSDKSRVLILKHYVLQIHLRTQGLLLKQLIFKTLCYAVASRQIFTSHPKISELIHNHQAEEICSNWILQS